MGKHYVFVEGKTDKEILDFFIRLKYPQLEDVVNIVPFKNPSRGGGKDYIPQILKAAIHLDETKNIIALFDNDTEGIYTKELLEQELKVSKIDMIIEFKNIKILSYPNTPFLKSYPVSNPISISKRNVVNDDINGKAGAIELYLPKKILIDDFTKELYPIRYYTYNQKVNKYQGGFPKKIKANIIEKFRLMKRKIETKLEKFIDNEWDGCDRIIRKIIKECKIKEES